MQPSIMPITSSASTKRHLQVELRELRLAVGAQVFVAEAAGDLHVAVVAGDHQNLLVELRRLRQRVERAVVHAAGHQVVAGPLRRAAAEDRRFDVDEVVLFEIVAHALVTRSRSSIVFCITGRRRSR